MRLDQWLAVENLKRHKYAQKEIKTHTWEGQIADTIQRDHSIYLFKWKTEFKNKNGKQKDW